MYDYLNNGTKERPQCPTCKTSHLKFKHPRIIISDLSKVFKIQKKIQRESFSSEWISINGRYSYTMNSSDLTLKALVFFSG